MTLFFSTRLLLLTAAFTSTLKFAECSRLHQLEDHKEEAPEDEEDDPFEHDLEPLEGEEEEEVGLDFVCPEACWECCPATKRGLFPKKGFSLKRFKCVLKYSSWLPTDRNCEVPTARNHESVQLKTVCNFNRGEFLAMDQCKSAAGEEPGASPELARLARERFEPRPSEVEKGLLPPVTTWCQPRGGAGCVRFSTASCAMAYEQCGPTYWAHPYCEEKPTGWTLMARVSVLADERKTTPCRQMTSLGPTTTPFSSNDCPHGYQACRPAILPGGTVDLGQSALNSIQQ